MVFANILLVILSILIFLFIFWKRLKDDYSSNVIFSAGFTIIILRFVFWYASTFLNQSLFFWLSFLGALIGLAISIFRFKMRFWETFESFAIAQLPTLSLLFLNDSVQKSLLSSFIAFLFTLLLIFIFVYIDINYKSFTWYKSGRIGLSGLVVFLIFFMARIVVSVFRFPLITIAQPFELYLSSFIVIITLWQLYLIQKS